MEFDVKKLDLITPIENEIQKIISENPQNIINLKLTEKTPEEMTLYLLTITSILYKHKHYIIYEIEKTKKINQKLTCELLACVDFLDKLIKELQGSIREKKISKALFTIISNKPFVSDILEMYFNIKETNYILEKMEIEQSTQTQKKHFEINPFIINQYIDYFLNKLTEEEKIIADILEFNRISIITLEEKETKDLNDFFKQKIALIKKQILKNYNENEIKEVILFMISNAYQELSENQKDKVYTKIKSIIENEEMTTEKLIKLFKQSESFSGIIIGKFIDYNLRIKKGRLEELKGKETYQFIKNKYKK